MIGDLNAVLGDRTPDGRYQWVEIFEGVGTILQRSAGKLLFRVNAAIALAERVNHDADAG